MEALDVLDTALSAIVVPVVTYLGSPDNAQVWQAEPTS